MKLIALLVLKFVILNLQMPSSDGIIINCEFADETTDEEFPAYVCNSMSMENLDNKVMESVTGDHEEGFANEDVDGLVLIGLGDSVLDYIPENIMEFFPKLTLFSIGFTNINRITSDDLRQFSTLKVFESMFNPITSLPGDLFKYNPELRQIGFRGSMTLTPTKDDSLSEIGENIFGDLEHLTDVLFVRHFCIQPDAYAFSREEVLDLNQRLPEMCPYVSVPTDEPTTEGTTEGQTSTTTETSTSQTEEQTSPTTEEQTSTTNELSSVSTDEQTSTTSEENSSPPSEATATSTTTTEKTTTSGQKALVNESQKLNIFFSFINFVILITVSNV